MIIVDDTDLPMLSKYSWKVRERFGHKQVVRFTRNRALGKQIQVSLAAELIGKKPELVIDHINGNPLDNRRSNLRHCKQSDNMKNRRAKGIYRTPQGKWRAEIQVDGIRHTSNHDTFDQAKEAREEMKRKYFGEFACQN